MEFIKQHGKKAVLKAINYVSIAFFGYELSQLSNGGASQIHYIHNMTIINDGKKSESTSINEVILTIFLCLLTVAVVAIIIVYFVLKYATKPKGNVATATVQYVKKETGNDGIQFSPA